jgi:hypothetical protein
MHKPQSFSTAVDPSSVQSGKGTSLRPARPEPPHGFHDSVVTWTPQLNSTQPNPRGTKVGEIMVDWAKEKAPLVGSPSDVNEAVVAAIL